MYDKFRETVRPFLKSKLEEFELYGYDRVTEEELWGFLKNKTWKKEKEEKRLYQLVGDILSVKVGDYMNYVTVEAFKAPSWFEGEGKDALNNLI
ncbi:post-transcriptional regulator [Bacillus sinesaloumensis]|uniref:post-transcriptional regulator n=1 Tax=Litchfieldia sinesaloumensis TaxID=1926280 RepID=UPI0009885E0E|nr:post-transcriptional regulator [Bacillus sinesaloumensis]